MTDESAACPVCGAAVPLRAGETLVQCRGCRSGLNVVRAGGAPRLAPSAYDAPAAAAAAPAARGSKAPLLAAALCFFTAMGAWHWQRLQDAKDAPPVVRAPASAAAPAHAGAPPSAPAPAARPEPARRAPAAAAPPPASAGLDAAKQPAFQGVLAAGKDVQALFRIPSGTGGSTWAGLPGQKIPGSSWTLRQVRMRPTCALIHVAGGPQLWLLVGETYAGGSKAVKAPEPPQAPVARVARQLPQPQWAARRPGGRSVNLSTGEGLELEPAAAAPPPRPAQAALPSNVSSVDAAQPQYAQFRSMYAPGRQTVVMVTSIRCGPCQQLKPRVLQWAREHPQGSVVLAEIGAAPSGGINFGAPISKTNNLPGVPYLVVFDTSGNIAAQGDAAYTYLGF